MISKTESDWTRQICKQIVDTGGKVFVIGAGRFNSSGLPDRFVSSIIWSGWIEFKGEGTAIRTDQLMTMRDMNIRSSGTSFIVRKPNLIYCVTGPTLEVKQIALFDGTGEGLLHELCRVSSAASAAT